jgi:hypothetical protein
VPATVNSINPFHLSLELSANLGLHLYLEPGNISAAYRVNQHILLPH